ncbi:hypothetical protein [Streptomyces longispororuber]|uniref:hypothetical protein n=1 Tax=Streptomyces longispororuber TaxID=68230 RepID=UPI0036FD5834
MPNRTDQPPDQPTPALPEPSYAAQVLTTIAAELDHPGARGRLLAEPSLRRAFTRAVAYRLHKLPTPIADTVAARVASLLPPGGPAITQHAVAIRLRDIAKGL